ncbi:MAG: TolC family protein, partial [Treponema sp.]|jgi:outer membrane protein TolC|nr:TolC family protein [Treponema sp.]
MKKILVVICFAMLSISGLSSQTINLEEARTLALANSRSLARYEMAIRSSLLDERNQLYNLLPQVSAGYNASMDFVRNWEFVNPADTLRTGASFSITQIIFQGGRNFIQKAISQISTEGVRKDALAEYFGVLDAIDNTYYAVLEATATLEAEESSLQAAVLGLSIAEIRQASGMINQGDYLRALADKESRENSRNQARRNLTLNMNRFRTLTGITGAVELEQINFEAYEDVITRLAVISDEEVHKLFDEFWEIIVVLNPNLAKASLSNQRAELNLTNTRRDYAPTISATIFSTDMSFLPSYNATGRSGVTIRGTIPVDFWVLNDRIEKSRISRDLTVLDFASAEISLEMELHNALLNAISQAGSVLSARRSLEYTEKNFEFIMERYRLLQSSVSDLTEATTLFINSRNSSTRVSYSFLQSLSRLRSLCAMDDEQRLLEILTR